MNNINYLDGIDIIYWMNLPKAKERKKYMEKILEDDIFTNTKIERIEAFDKTDDIFDKLNLIQRKIADSEYACLLTHLETIRKFSETNYKTALIFEDDVSLEYKKYWTKSLKQIMENAPKNWDILKLCIMKPKQNKKLYTHWKLNTYYNYNTILLHNDFGAESYIITNKAAKKLVNEIYHNKKYILDEHIQHYTDSFIFTKLNTFTYKFPFFTTRNHNDTQIQLSTSYTNKMKNITDKFYKKIKNKTRKRKL